MCKHKSVIILFILIFITVRTSIAQTEITWQTLGNVRFTDKYSEEVEAYFFDDMLARPMCVLSTPTERKHAPSPARFATMCSLRFFGATSRIPKRAAG